MPQASILIIEDDASIAEVIELFLLHADYSVCGIATSADSALAQVNTVRPDLALMDIQIEGSISGIELAQTLRQDFDIPVVFMTAHADASTVQKAVATEPFGYLIKPVDRHVLAATLQTAMARIKTERKLVRAEQTLAATLDSIGEAVIVIDGNYRITFMNNIAQQLTEWPRQEALGRAIHDVLTLHDADKHPILSDLLENALSSTPSPQNFPANVDLISRTGSNAIVNSTVNPIRGKNNRVMGLVLVLRALHDAD